MAGRPSIPDEQKKVREAIYFKPNVLAWLKDKAEKRDSTTSSLVNVIVERYIEDEKKRKDRT